MTWPTTNISTTNLDAGTDNPAIARSDIKDMADAVNGMMSEFDSVSIASPTTDELLQWDGSSWVNQDLIMKDYQERIVDLGTKSSGTVTIDFAAGPVQTVTLTGNVTFAFANASLETAKSVSIWLRHSGAGRSITWPSGTRFAYADSVLSTTDGAIDLIHIQSVYIFGSVYKMVSVIRGFA